MTEPLTFKLDLPPVLAPPPVVPRDHFSGSGEDVRYEPETPKANGEEGVPV